MYIIVFVTAVDKKQARIIARELLRRKVAACVNIVGKVQSFFWWQGKIDEAGEVMLVIKSKKALLPAITRIVKALHSYEVPEIIAVPVAGGEKKYLRWIHDSCAAAS